MWCGYKISTGPLDFSLDDSTGISCGVMNYELGVVSSEFHVLVRFRRSPLSASNFCSGSSARPARIAGCIL